jgi:hypothetical protein
MKYSVSIFLSLIIGIATANVNEESSIEAKEIVLSMQLDALRIAKNDSEKAEKNTIFKNSLKEILQLKEAFSYPFNRLKTVGFVDSPDKQLRIVNWNVEQEDQTQRYYCFLLHVDEKKKNIELSELLDNSQFSPPRPDGILEAKDWYGALYYKIIPIEKGTKTVYTLLGWDGNNSMSSIKLIDALYFAGNNPKLGSPIFKTKETTLKRVFYEHSKKTTMSLRFEPEYERIIFDHLSPEAPNLKGFYSFYVPDLSLDAFVLSGNKWLLKEDVIGINKATDSKKEIFVKNERTGKIEKQEIKNKWESPEDKGSPGGGNIHIAVTPEKDLQNPIAIKNDLNKKATRRDRRNPENMNATLGRKNNRRKN